MAPTEHKLVEIDASELTYPEWFFLWAAAGAKPDANLKDIGEWRKRSLGLTQAQKLITFREGLEALMARGFIKQERDANGSLVFDAENKPVYVMAGRVVSRVSAYNQKPLV